MRQRFIIQSIVILLLLSIWSFFNYTYIYALSKSFTETARTNVKIFSKNKQILDYFKLGLEDIEKKSPQHLRTKKIKKITKNLKEKYNIFSSIDKLVDYLISLQEQPLHSKLYLKTNKELSLEVAKKYNVSYKEYIEKTVNKLPHMLVVEADIEKIGSTKNYNDYLLLYKKYEKNISIRPEFSLIQTKIKEGIRIHTFFYIFNGVMAFLVFLFIFFQRLYFESKNSKQWEIYKSLGYPFSYRRKKYFLTTLIFSLYPIIFSFISPIIFIRYNLLEQFGISYPLVFKMFIMFPIIEFSVVFFANTITGFFLKKEEI